MKLRCCSIVVVVVLGISSCLSQGLNPVLYSGSHLLSTIQGPSTEEAGRGGAGVAVDSPYGGNPASVPTKHSLSTMYMSTSFPNGLDVRLSSTKVTVPLSNNTGLMLNWGHQSSSSGVISGVNFIDVGSTSLTVSIGHTVNDSIKIGIALAPKMETSLRVSDGTATLMKLSSSERYGARLGVLYDLSRDVSFGCTYDNYLEKVIQIVGATSVTNDFRSEALRTGVAYSGNDLMVALDRYHATIRGSSRASIDQWLVGVDYFINEKWTARTGYWDGGWSTGVGYTDRGWEINAAFVRDIWGKQFDPMMGGAGSDTLSLNIAKIW